MAKEKNFDFEELQKLNLAKYLKAYCKPVQVNKAKACIILTDYKLSGKKMPFIFLPFKKLPEAAEVFKEIKADKTHILKKVGFAAVVVDKKAGEISFVMKKGGLDTATLKSKGESFFESNFKLAIKTDQSAAELVADKKDAVKEEKTTEGTSGTADASATTAEKPKKKLTPEKRAKINENMASIEGELDKIAKALKVDVA
jgi:hypothetical protein